MNIISKKLHKNASAITLIWERLKDNFVQPVTNTRICLHMTGKTRRFYLVHFKKKYVQNQLHMRSGKCNQCGFCCNMLFTCPFLTNDDKCVAYGKCRPESCKVFPIDQRDIEEVRMCGNRCGYNFED